MNNLEVIVVNSQKEYGDVMDKWNKQTAIIMDNTYKYYINELPHDVQKVMFHDWWHGTCVSKEDYQQEVGISRELAYDVHSCILEACSRGFG